MFLEIKKPPSGLGQSSISEAPHWIFWVGSIASLSMLLLVLLRRK